jgi:imidazole glycerol phosphate synthase subunit HisF
VRRSGEPDDFVEAVTMGGADAVSAASIFHFTKDTPNDVKNRMRQATLDDRI